MTGAEASFAGRVAWVTGAAGGIGAALARQLAHRGARVALSDREGAALDAVAKSLPGSLAVPFDLRSEAGATNAVKVIEAELGPLRHAALVAGTHAAGSFLELGEARELEQFEINTFGTMRCLRAAAVTMASRKQGSVVVVASLSAKMVRLNQAAYGASKAAINYYAKAAGLELAPLGVRVNVVHPGTTDTPMSRVVWDRAGLTEPPQIRGELARYRVPIPLGAVATPDEVANAITFLLSDAASHVTISEITVDGGVSLLP